MIYESRMKCYSTSRLRFLSPKNKSQMEIVVSATAPFNAHQMNMQKQNVADKCQQKLDKRAAIQNDQPGAPLERLRTWKYIYIRVFGEMCVKLRNVKTTE